MLGPLHGGCVVRYSNTSAHAMVGTSSIARETNNTQSQGREYVHRHALHVFPSFLKVGLILQPSLVS
jgi:hypothetical protein